MDSLATLTAQRPTLLNLLTEGEQAPLLTYLRQLQAGAELDLILICDQNRQVVAQAGETPPQTLCSNGVSTGFHVIPTETPALVWLVAAHPVSNLEAGMQGQVIVGVLVDEAFAGQMRAQTGLEHTLLVDSQPVISSLPTNFSSRRTAHSDTSDNPTRSTFTLNGRPLLCPEITP